MGSIKIDSSDYPKSLISRINEVFCYSDILLKNIKFIYTVCFAAITFVYCVNMVSVMSASRNITSASRYHPRY